jgi:hypothetical protein
VFPKSRIFKSLKSDCGTIPVAEIISGKIEIRLLLLLLLCIKERKKVPKISKFNRPNQIPLTELIDIYLHCFVLYFYYICIAFVSF